MIQNNLSLIEDPILKRKEFAKWVAHQQWTSSQSVKVSQIFMHNQICRSISILIITYPIIKILKLNIQILFHEVVFTFLGTMNKTCLDLDSNIINQFINEVNDFVSQTLKLKTTITASHLLSIKIKAK